MFRRSTLYELIWQTDVGEARYTYIYIYIYIYICIGIYAKKTPNRRIPRIDHDVEEERFDGDGRVVRADFCAM